MITMQTMELTEADLKNKVGDALDYLEVDSFLIGFTAVQALHAALSLGLIDRLASAPGGSCDSARLATGLDPRGTGLLLDILHAGGVIETAGESSALRPSSWSLSERFNRILRFREYIECRIEFARLITPDLLGRLPAFAASPENFMQGSSLFALFDYGRCFERTDENLAATKRWVRVTTAYTRHEAPVLLRLLDLSQQQHMLDIGGNSGEMVRQACERWPSLRATVIDLPLVCEVGQRHVAASPAAGRIRFAALDALSAPLPRADLVLFKSVLHDWPDEAVRLMLVNARKALTAGGRLLIFERCRGDLGAADLGADELGYGFLPLLLFFQGFRTPAAYEGLLGEAGFSIEQIVTLKLDTRFCLIIARC